MSCSNQFRIVAHHYPVHDQDQILDQRWFDEFRITLGHLSVITVKLFTELYDSAIFDLVLCRDRILRFSQPSIPHRLASVFGQSMHDAWVVPGLPCRTYQEQCGPFEHCVSLDIYDRTASCGFAGGACTNCAFLGCPEECNLTSILQSQGMNLVGRGGGPSLAAQTSLMRLSNVKMGSHQAKVVLNPNNHTYESEETEVVKITVSGRSRSSARFLSKVHHILPALHEDESWKTKYLSDCSQNTNVPLSETNESQYTSESEARMIEGVDILAHLGCSPKSKNILKTDDRTYNEYSIIESDQSNNRVTPEEEMSDSATQMDPIIPRGQTSRLHQKDSCINRTERPSDNVHASKIQSTLSFSAHETLSLRDRLAQKSRTGLRLEADSSKSTVLVT